MAYELRDNSGSLFKNKKKEPGSNQPDLQGDCMVDGVKKQFSAWTKVTKEGDKWLSIQFKEPFVKTQKVEPPPAQFDDPDVPF